jgi:hypothetical protein
MRLDRYYRELAAAARPAIALQIVRTEINRPVRDGGGRAGA